MNSDLLGFAAALSAATQTGLLLQLVGAPRTAADHAAAAKLDPRATERVLDVLVAFGVAARVGNTFAASSWLATQLERSPGGPQNMTALWLHVPEFLRTGQPYIKMDAAREATYQNVVAALGKMFAPAAANLATALPRSPSHVLDIGCGSGVWSLAIAQRHSGARVTGLDLPAVLEAFRARATELGLADRIATLPGDVHELAIPREFDLVVVANVLRIESPERARAIVQRAAAALVPGGELLIVDALGGGTPEKEQGRTVYGLHLAMRTEHGRVYTPAEITSWLKEAGLKTVETIDLETEQIGALAALLAR